MYDRNAKRMLLKISLLFLCGFGFLQVEASDVEIEFSHDGTCSSFFGYPGKKEFYSPNYPSQYPVHIVCTMRLTANEGQIVTVDFKTVFDLESCGGCTCDFLEVRDGGNGSSPLIGTFCGKQFPQKIYSSDRHLWLRFVSNGRTTGKGFWAVYDFVTIPTPAPATTPAPSPEEVLRRTVRDVSAPLLQWFLNRRRPLSVVEKWGDQLHRTATALFLGGHDMGDSFGQEMAYELTVRLLSYLATSKEGSIPSDELALYINALQVICLNPKDFHGKNLVADLRTAVESGNYTNPFEVLVLCTSGDRMTGQDMERITRAHDSQHRPFWIENQAMATMAVACLSSRSDVTVDERVLLDMAQDLKKRQFRNGTVDNLRTTALVLQALSAANSTAGDFNKTAAIRSLQLGQKSDGSYGTFLNSYYVLPALNDKSLADVGSSHCARHSPTAEETLADLLKVSDSRFHVQYTVWIRQQVVLGRTWRLMLRPDSTVYDVIETVNRLDYMHNTTYSVFEGKPYISGISGIQDDPESGVYWFIYIRKKDSQEQPVLKDESPVDLKLQPNQEVILWYRKAQWKEE